MKGYEVMTLKECLDTIDIIKLMISIKEDLLEMQIKNNKSEKAKSTTEMIHRLNKELKRLEDNLEVIQSKEIDNSKVKLGEDK